MGAKLRIMRKENWPQLLDDVINEYKEIPFEWGISDCLQFSMTAAQRLIDRDITTQFSARNDYSTEQGGADRLAEFFGGSYENIFDEVFIQTGSNKLAKRGDVVLILLEDREICAIVDGSGRYAVCKTLDGVIFIPLRMAVKVWRVE